MAGVAEEGDFGAVDSAREAGLGAGGVEVLAEGPLEAEERAGNGE